MLSSISVTLKSPWERAHRRVLRLQAAFHVLGMDIDQSSSSSSSSCSFLLVQCYYYCYCYYSSSSSSSSSSSIQQQHWTCSKFGVEWKPILFPGFEHYVKFPRTWKQQFPVCPVSNSGHQKSSLSKGNIRVCSPWWLPRHLQSCSFLGCKTST